MGVHPAEETGHNGQCECSDYATRYVGEYSDGCGGVEGRAQVKKANTRYSLEQAVDDWDHHSMPHTQDLHFQSNHLQSQNPPREKREAHHGQRGGRVGEELHRPFSPQGCRH